MKPEQQLDTPPWESKLAVFLRTVILASGLFQTFFGETVAGALTLICLALIVFPSFLSRGRMKKLPIEIEIILFIMVIVQFTIGEVHNFYTAVPYYDKFVHYLLPLFVGFIAFLIAYTMSVTGRLQLSNAALIVLIVLLAAGVGAVWEIIEYSSDKWLYPNIPGWHHFQGNSEQTAIVDTMSDIILDTLGGVFGAVLGLRYVNRKKTENSLQLNRLVREISVLFQPAQNNSRKK